MRGSLRAPFYPICTLASVLIVGLAAHSACAQEATLVQLEQLEKRERITRHRARLMPAPLSQSVIAAWAGQLGLDDDVTELLSELRTQYRVRTRRLDTSHRHRIESLWPAGFEYSRTARRVAPVANPQLLELHKEYKELLDKLMAADRALFSPLHAVLGGRQALELRHRQVDRLLSYVDIPSDLPEATVDLGDLLAQLDLSIDAQELADTALATHYAELIDQLDSVVPGQAEIMLRRARLLVAAGPRWELAASREDREHFTQALAELDRHEVDLWKRLALTNYDGVDRLASRLPGDRRIEFRSSYHRVIWPELFEEQQEAIKLSNRVRSWLPSDDETTSLLLDRASDSMMKSLADLARKEIEHRFNNFSGRSVSGVGANHGLTTHVHSNDGIIAELADEIGWYKFRLRQREIIERFSATLLAMNRIHRPENVKLVTRYRESLEDRIDADRHRVGALERRVEQVRELRADDGRE